MLMNIARRVSAETRRRRFDQLESFAAGLPRPLRVIDVGGTNEFWEAGGWAGREDIEITLVNHVSQPQTHENIIPTVGDAADLPHDDASFDLAFSNSVIEHLFTWECQEKMAREMQRVGKHHWVQTPNYWFPLEPHFQFVGWQWLPEQTRVAILRRRRCGWRDKTPDPDQARELVREVRLLTRSELRRLFPHSEIRAERMAGLVKSWIVVGSSEEAHRAAPELVTHCAT